MNTPKKIIDGLLVLQCQAGNKKAFSLLVKRWQIKLCNQAFWYTKDSDEAKDIVQDSWSIILKNIHGLKDVNSFGCWALKIVNRKAIDWLRKNKKEDKRLHEYYENSKLDVTAINNTDNQNNKHHTVETVLIAIKELPENQQIVLRLFYLEKYTINEISKILELSIGTVKSRLFYAREKLKIILKT